MITRHTTGVCQLPGSSPGAGCLNCSQWHNEWKNDDGEWVTYGNHLLDSKEQLDMKPRIESTQCNSEFSGLPLFDWATK